MPPVRSPFSFRIRGLASGDAPIITLMDRFGSATWEGEPGREPTRLAYVPGRGVFRRIVVDAGQAEFAESCVIRADKALIRFTDRIEGERASPLDSVEKTEAGYTMLGGGVKAVELTGRFIEGAFGPIRSDLQVVSRCRVQPPFRSEMRVGRKLNPSGRTAP